MIPKRALLKFAVFQTSFKTCFIADVATMVAWSLKKKEVNKIKIKSLKERPSGLICQEEERRNRSV